MTITAGLLNQTIDYVYSTSKDRYGDTTNTLEYNDISCRWQHIIKRIVTAQDERIISTVQVWLSPDYDAIQEGWKIRHNSITYSIAIKEQKYNLSGELDHIKLYLVK